MGEESEKDCQREGIRCPRSITAEAAADESATQPSAMVHGIKPAVKAAIVELASRRKSGEQRATNMLKSSIFRVVDFCSLYAWWVIVLAVALAAGSTAYTTQHFAIKTDVKDPFPA